MARKKGTRSVEFKLRVTAELKAQLESAASSSGASLSSEAHRRLERSFAQAAEFDAAAVGYEAVIASLRAELGIARLLRELGEDHAEIDFIQRKADRFNGQTQC